MQSEVEWDLLGLILNRMELELCLPTFGPRNERNFPTLKLSECGVTKVVGLTTKEGSD